MMKGLFVLLFVGAVCVLAQETEEIKSGDADPMVPDQLLMMQVQQEQMISKKYLDTILKLQHAQFNTMSSSMIVQMLMLEYQENSAAPKDEGSDDYFSDGNNDDDDDDDDDDDVLSLLEKSSKTQSLEEDSTLFNEAGLNMDQVKLDLISSYYMYHAIKIRFYQTVFLASELQNEFFMDRTLTLQIQSLGAQLPPQLLQLLYLKQYKTLLSTMKLSYAFQMINHWTMWLEDAIDVNQAITDPTNKFTQIVLADQADDLIRDKMWAFSAYNTYAMLDFQIFYIDLYFESALMGSQQQPGVSFLEEGAQVGEEAEPNQFFPFMAAQGNPMMYMKIYKMYYLMFQMYSAHSATTSVFAEHLAFEKENDDDPSNDDQAAQYRKFAQQCYGSFGTNLLHASQIESITGYFDLYALYMPMMGGAPGAKASKA